MKQITVRYTDEFPRSVGGLCIPRDDEYLIVINANMDRYHQWNALGHEFAHICLGHLDTKQGTVKQMELEANLLSWEYYQRFRDHRLHKKYNIKIIEYPRLNYES